MNFRRDRLLSESILMDTCIEIKLVLYEISSRKFAEEVFEKFFLVFKKLSLMTEAILNRVNCPYVYNYGCNTYLILSLAR